MSLKCYWLEHVLCIQDKACKFFLSLSVITQVIYVLYGIWRHHLLSNKVGQNSSPLILDNNHSKFSVICVRFMHKYFLFPFLIRRRLSFLKTFLVMFNLCQKEAGHKYRKAVLHDADKKNRTRQRQWATTSVVYRGNNPPLAFFS